MSNISTRTTYVAPTALLPAAVSEDLLSSACSYLRVVRVLDQHECLVRVAPSPELLDTCQSQVIVLRSELLKRAAVWQSHQDEEVYTCCMVAPAEVLSPEPVDERDHASMRQVASAANLCYIRKEFHMEEHLWLTRVAALPHRLDDPARSYVVLLTSAQLALAIPWERHMGSMVTHELRESVVDHARQVDSTFTPCTRISAAQRAAIPMVEDDRPAADREPLTFATVAEIFAPQSLLDMALSSVGREDIGAQSRRMQLALLRAALLELKLEMEQETQPDQLRELKDQDKAVRTVLVFRDYLFKQQPRLVDVDPVYEEGRMVGCTLRILRVSHAA
jgi:hypothetical protein